MTDEFDVAGWIESGTAKRVTVTIYNAADVAARAEALVAERDEIERRVARESGGDRTLADADPFAEIDAQIEALNAEFEASQSEWVLAPVPADTQDDIRAAHPEPPTPRKPAPNAPPEDMDAYAERLAGWRAHATQVDLERNIAYVAASVVEVRQSGKSASGVTPDVVRALRNRPHGKVQYELLLTRAIEVTNGEVAMPIPKSSTTSNGIPT